MGTANYYEISVPWYTGTGANTDLDSIKGLVLCRLASLCTHDIPPVNSLGTDVFSTSTDGVVYLWDIRKLIEPVESWPLQQKDSDMSLGGISLDFESTMVSCTVCIMFMPVVRYIGTYVVMYM